MILKIVFLGFLLALALVIVLPPYWPLHKPWGRLQKLKLWTLGILLVNVLVGQSSQIADRNMPPDITCGNFILPYYFFFFCFGVPLLFFLGIALLFNYYKWHKQGHAKDEEPDGEKGYRSKYIIRTVLVAGAFGLLLYGFSSNLYELSKPAPVWPEEYYEYHDNIDTTAIVEIDSLDVDPDGADELESIKAP